MGKTRTTVYVENEVKEHAKNNNISLTDFLNSTYEEKHLGVEEKKRKLADLKKEIILLEENIKFAELDREERKFVLNNEEKKTIRKARAAVAQGKDVVTEMLAFNLRHHKDFELQDFVKVMQLYEAIEEKRLSYALSKKDKKGAYHK